MREGSDLDSFSFLSIPRVARQVTFFKSLRLQLSRTFVLTVNFLFACRIFSIRRCARCGAGIGSSDLVMRARDLIFHVNCFSCALCGLPLSAGDTAGIRGGRVFCCEHYETELQLWVLRKFIYELVQDFSFSPSSEAANIPLQQIPYYPPTTQQKGRPRKRKLLQTDETIITNSDGPPEHHLSHDGALRLGENLRTLLN